MRNWFKNVVAAQMRAGATPSEAIDFAIGVLSGVVSQRVASGASLEEVLKDVGLPGTVVRQIRQASPSPTMLDLLGLDALGRAAVTVATAIRKVVGGGGVAGIPTAECLHRHLPVDREPTLEDVEAAWKACTEQ